MSFESVNIYQTLVDMAKLKFFLALPLQGYILWLKTSTDLQFLSSSLYPKSLNRSGNGENTRKKIINGENTREKKIKKR